MAKDLAVQQEKAVALRDYMQGDNIKNQLSSALPKWLSADRLLRIVFTSVMKNPKLIDCTRESILSSVMQCAQLGLEPILGRSYLIPYENKKYINGAWVKVPECQMQIGYQGLVDLARRTDTIADVWGANVYENDDFSMQYGMNRNLHHVPWFMDPEKRKAGESGEVIGAYVVWKLKDETMHPEFMSIIDIHKRRDKSQSYAWAHTGNPKQGGGKKNSVWHEWPEEMNLKTVIKHSSKLIPASIEFMQAVELDSAAESGLSTAGFFEDQITLPDPLPAKQISESDQAEDTSSTAENNTAQNSTIQNDSIKKQFNATFGDPETNPQLKLFLSGTAEMNDTAISDIMKSALENVTPFKTAFVQWKSKQDPPTANPGQAQTTEDTTAADLPEYQFVKKWNRLHPPAYEKFVKKHFAEFEKYSKKVEAKAKKKWLGFGFTAEQWPSIVDADGDLSTNPNSGGIDEGHSKPGAENVQSGASGAVDITQTDEWSEISMLQERYPDIYSRLAKGRALQTLADLSALINDITDAVDLDEVEAGQLGVDASQQPPVGDDDIPH
jgi:recombination protein RecT